MSLVTGSAANKNIAEYDKLVQLKTRITDIVTDWVQRGAGLHGALSDPAEKAEVIALRNQLDAEITAILGA